MKVYLSPSMQNYNRYSYGNTTECDECDKIASACETAMKRCGIPVVKAPKGQSAEKNVAQSNAIEADYHICIHTNAGGGRGVVVFTSANNVNCVEAKEIYNAIDAIDSHKSVYGVRSASFYEINGTTAKCIYIECEFHDNAELAKFIIEHTEQYGEAICKGFCKATGIKYIYPNTKSPSETDVYKQKAINKGVIKGYGNGDYGWKDPITREQFITIIGRLGLLD